MLVFLLKFWFWTTVVLALLGVPWAGGWPVTLIGFLIWKLWDVTHPNTTSPSYKELQEYIGKLAKPRPRRIVSKRNAMILRG